MNAIQHSCHVTELPVGGVVLGLSQYQHHPLTLTHPMKIDLALL